jgi:hypothetical protein
VSPYLLHTHSQIVFYTLYTSLSPDRRTASFPGVSRRIACILQVYRTLKIGANFLLIIFLPHHPWAFFAERAGGSHTFRSSLIHMAWRERVVQIVRKRKATKLMKFGLLLLMDDGLTVLHWSQVRNFRWARCLAHRLVASCCRVSKRII